MSDKVKIVYLCLLGGCCALCGALVALGHDSSITNSFIALLGVIGGTGIWERLTQKGGDTSGKANSA
jgi:hypothetical protein